jgi:hypothetical protein
MGGEEENPGMGFLDRPVIGTFSPAKTRDFLTGGNKRLAENNFTQLR